MANRMYRAGVVGLSGISMRPPDVDSGATLNTPMPHSHVGAYSVLPHIELAAVCELKTELFDKFKEDWGDVFPETRTYTDYREMINKENLDILNVVTSDNRHTDIVIYGANAGVKGIVCEKPLATTVDDCNRMIEACEKNGTVMTVDHTRRWWPAYHRARQAIREGAIGKVRRIVANMGGGRAMLFRNGTHLLDGVVFFAESGPEWVFAELDEGFEDYFSYRGDGGRSPEGDPGGSGYIHFKNGVRAFVNVSKGQMPAAYLQVIGETGQIDVGGGFGEVTLHQGGRKSELMGRTAYMKIGILACIEDVIRVMEHGGEVAVTPREGKYVVEIIVGFLKSQERGNVRVELPLPLGN